MSIILVINVLVKSILQNVLRLIAESLLFYTVHFT